MISKILNQPNDSTSKTIFVALALCLVCSIAVSGAAVLLKPIQERNKLLDKKRNILQIAGLMQEDKSIDELFAQIEPKAVSLATGEYDNDINVDTFDARKAAVDPTRNKVLTKDEDIASIKRHAQHAIIYLVKDDAGIVKKLILPVYGYGLWSTLYGFIALEPDANTVVGFGFYEHAETPGLGGEVDNPQWKASWQGKEVFKEGRVAIELVKNATAKHEVDGLSGATLTANGVENLVKFWLGENGFGPYLQKFRAGGDV